MVDSVAIDVLEFPVRSTDGNWRAASSPASMISTTVE